MSCGAGLEQRERTCVTPSTSTGTGCHGDYLDYRICETPQCQGMFNSENTRSLLIKLVIMLSSEC